MSLFHSGSASGIYSGQLMTSTCSLSSVAGVIGPEPSVNRRLDIGQTLLATAIRSEEHQMGNKPESA